MQNIKQKILDEMNQYIKAQKVFATSNAASNRVIAMLVAKRIVEKAFEENKTC